MTALKSRSWLNKEVWRWLRGVFGEVIFPSTKLLAEDRTEYTDADGGEEEGKTLAVGNIRREREDKQG